MKAESHPFQYLPLKNRYPASQWPELCVPWLCFNHYKCASFLSPRPTLLTSHKTPKGGAWLGLAGCPSEWKDLGIYTTLRLMSPPEKVTLAEGVHFINTVRQGEPQWGNQDGGEECDRKLFIACIHWGCTETTPQAWLCSGINIGKQN